MHTACNIPLNYPQSIPSLLQVYPTGDRVPEHHGGAHACKLLMLVVVLYRVRQEAAIALATTASLDTEFAGFQILLKVFKARCHSGTGTAAPQAQAGQSPPLTPPPPPWPPHPTCTGATPAWSVSWSRRKPRQSLEDITSAALPTPNLLYPPTHHTGLGHIKLGTTMCFSDVELHSVFFPFRSRYGRTERWGVPGQ